MGKKPQKTKELTVATAEASSTGDETKPQQSQTPRKRGRPRKIVEKSETEEKKELIQQSAAEGAESSLKTPKSMDKEEEEKEVHGRQQDETKQEGSSAICMKVLTKEEGLSKEMQLIPKGHPTRSRARRKSKPRKSS